jgi:outer membrane receptor protein involved in Fe transport
MMFLSIGLLLASNAAAQLASQTALVGTVSDSDGLAMPGAQVVAVNTGTKDTYETTTNEQGQYNIQFVRTGSYEITITLQGFQTFKATGVVVGTNQVVRTNGTLQPGGINETINIVAEAQVLNTDSATVSETIGERAIKELPIPGRNVFNLAATTPGVLTGLTGDQGLNFRGAGQREIQNSLSLDGISSSANLLAATSMRPIADAVTEVQVQTGSTSAEYGSYLGVYVNVVTKSGTNDYHGALAHYYQGDNLDARGYFENRANPKNPRKRNQFSYEFDGPLSIPGLYNGRDKTFFMAAYEGIRSQATLASFGTVPTALMRTGNFSELSTPIKNPLTGQNFAGNIIPQSLISPVSQKLLQYYPVPNLPGTASNLATTRTEVRDNDQLLFRVDQNLGNKVRFNVRYNWLDAFDDNLETIPVSSTTQPRNNKNTLVSYTHTLSPNLHNDFRIGYHRLQFDTLGYFDQQGIANAGTELGIPGFDADTRFNNLGIPTINVNNFNALGAAGTNWYQFDTTFQASNVLSWTKGEHNIRTGFDLRQMKTGRRASNDPRGAFTFTGDLSGYSAADFMLGLPRTVRNAVDQIQGHVGGWRNGFFVNDVWQAAPNLTLSLGLRYEMNTPVQTYIGRATMLADDGLTLIPTPSTLPQPGFEFTEANKKDFAPRLGATYRLGDKTVVRAGYGIYYNPNQMNSYTFLTNNPGVSPEITYSTDVANPNLSFANPTGPVAPGGPTDVISPTRKLPNAQKRQWSFDLQRELAAGMVFDLQYVGSHTKNLDRSFFNNTPTPGPGAVDPRRPTTLYRTRRIIANDLIADYDAVSFIVRKRMNNGLQVDAHYTWSKTRDITTHSNGGGQTMDNYDPMRDYGPANWDVPHRFVASYIYDIPFGKTSSNPFVRYVAAGWQISGVTTLQSGQPVNPTLSTDRANIGITGQQRPDLVGAIPEMNCQTDSATRQRTNCFDATAFALPAQFTFGNAGRNILRGPRFLVTDLSAVKELAFGNTRLQLRAEFYNVFNNVNLGQPNAVFGSQNFGRITTVATGSNMRQLQLGARFLF